jgi:hypothetical protein
MAEANSASYVSISKTCGHEPCAKGTSVILRKEFPVTEAAGAYLPEKFYVHGIYTDDEVHYHKTLNKWMVTPPFRNGNEVLCFDNQEDALLFYQHHATYECGFCHENIINNSVREYRETSSTVVFGCALCLRRMEDAGTLRCESCNERWQKDALPLRIIDKYGKAYYVHEKCVQYNRSGSLMEWNIKPLADKDTKEKMINNLLKTLEDMKETPCIECCRPSGAVVACRKCPFASHILCLPVNKSGRVIPDPDGNIHYFCVNCHLL